MIAHRLPRLLLALLLLGLLAGGLGCGKRKETPAATAATADDASAPAEPLTVEDLEPVLREVTVAGGGPIKIVVELATPAVDEARVGSEAEDSELQISPPVAGELRWTSRSTLAFEPAVGFVPGTRYEIELLAVETRDGVLRTPAPRRWSRVVETPALGLVRMALASVAYVAQEARLDLVFSAAVDPEEVERRARFDVVRPGRSAVAKAVRFERGGDPLTVRAVLRGELVAAGSRVEVSLKPGIPAAADRSRTAGAHRESLTLAEGKETRLLAVYRGESTNGFYVQVVCDDTSVEERRYYWDRTLQESYQVSTRCQPAEQDLAAIEIEPAIALSVSPASGGFRIFGAFERGAYKLRLPAGLRTADGGMVYQGWEGEIAIPVRSPRVSFASQGRYLPREAWKSLPIRHLNVAKATLHIRHVPAENLVFWMSSDYGESADERTSDLVYQDELPFQGPTDVETTTFVDLGTRIPADTRGLLEVQLSSAGGATDTARILLTDLHLVAKRSGVVAGAAANAPWTGSSVRVWALDVDTTEPQRGVDLKLVRKSGFVLAACRTGGDGGCDLAVPDDTVDPGPPFAVVASRGQDLTYLRFADLRAEVQEARVSGDPYRGETQPYRAAVYADRGVYRPGETVHLAAIVRDKDLVAPPAKMPVDARLTDSQGRIVDRRTLATNAAGYATLDVALPPFATTGRHELVLAVADRTLGSASFQVEEFVPERMRVEAGSPEPRYRLGDEMKVEVDARYLFGGVPAGHRVELDCELRPSTFAPERLASYQFGVWHPDEDPVRPIGLGTVAGELDDAGRGELACPGPSGAGGFRGPAELVARAAVFEAGSGRTTVGQATVPVHPERFYLGLQARSKEAKAGQELQVEGVVVDWEGRPVAEALEVAVELVRLDEEWGWYFDPDLGYDSFRQYRRPVVEERTTVHAKDGKLAIAFTPRTDASAFLVRASAGAAQTDLEVEGSGWTYWWDSEYSSNETPKPGRPTWLALSAPSSVKVGERFPVRFTAPYRGRVLLTAETDRILSSEWLEVDAGEAVWWFEADDFVPNVYVSALMVKDPHLDSPGAYLPARAFGVQSVRLEPEDYTYPLAVTAPAEVRSRSKLAVTLDLGKTEGPTFATVAAVDQGILSLTRFESPDPAATIFARRALGIETFETIGWSLMVPPGAPSSTVGGDEGALPGRIDAVKPVALWSGLVEVPASGRTTVELELPQYRGELRVMAVAAGPKKLGRAETRVVVRDPLVVEATLPRFLSEDDELEIPVFVTNLSGKAAEVAVSLAVADLPIGGASAAPGGESSPVTIVGEARKSLSLADGANGIAVFRAKATRPTGAATLTVTASAGGYDAVQANDVPLLPVGPKSRVVQRIAIEAGDTDLVPYLEGWQPLSERSSLLVSANPYGDAFAHLSYLARYPYGCIEQTTSSLRPLLYLGRLLDVFDPEIAKRGSVDAMIESGIERLMSMQTPSGGFGYWPGDREPITWGTANAVQLLVDARDLDHPVPADRLEDAVGWLEREIANVYEAGQVDDYHQGAEPYVHYVLARASRARKARIETLLGELAGQSHGRAREDRYLLQAALFLAGDRRFESELRHPDLSPVVDERWDGWTFYSDRRRRGMTLSVFTDLFGHDAAGEPLADLVAESLRGQPSGWYTTQELVWGVAGLGKFVEAGTSSFEPPILKAGSRELKPLARAKDAGADRAWDVVRASEIESLTLTVPKKGEGKLYLVLASEGVRRDGDWRTGGEGLAISRTYLDAEGSPIDLDAPLPLGTVVNVELEVSNESGAKVSNVALVDRIPAGWEIENPRLGREGAESLDWIDADSLWDAAHMNLRDDRLEVFGHLESGETKTVVYAVRATTAGRFTIPPIEAEAMYNPRLWAREAGGKVEIAAR